MDVDILRKLGFYKDDKKDKKEQKNVPYYFIPIPESVEPLITIPEKGGSQKDEIEMDG